MFDVFHVDYKKLKLNSGSDIISTRKRSNTEEIDEFDKIDAIIAKISHTQQNGTELS